MSEPPRSAPAPTLPPPLAQPAVVYVQVPAQQERDGLVSGCAQLIGALILLAIGGFLLLYVPIIGIAYFGLLVIIALVRVVFR